MGPTEPRTSLRTATPFSRLAFAHIASVTSDAFLTVALAGTIFFTAAPGEARPKVLLYLVITMVPFTLLAPVLGPAIDRSKGGRRLLIVLTLVGRGVLCLVMAQNVDGLLLYPLAFGALMLSKGYAVAKNALVPALVDDVSELVRANSRLALLSGLAAAIGGIPAAAILAVGGGEWVLRVGALAFFGAAVVALGIPRAEVRGREETDQERHELQAPGIVLAGTAMGLHRGAIGFLTFFLAFVLKDQQAPEWFYGVLIAASGLGNFAGVIVAPRLRRHVREEWMLAASLFVPAPVLIFAARSATRPALMLAALMIAAGAALGRQGFDSLLQRDAPDSIRGRVFARFETRFQLAWVVGGVLAVALVPMTARAGLFLVAVLLGFGGLSYLGSIRGTPAGRIRRTERAQQAAHDAADGTAPEPAAPAGGAATAPLAPPPPGAGRMRRVRRRRRPPGPAPTPAPEHRRPSSTPHASDSFRIGP